jgi:hypothetical protein
MFSTANTMRKNNMSRIKGAWRTKPWKKVRLRRRKQGVDFSEIDLWGVEKAREELSLPSWACSDADEERRLAAMKIILEKDLEALKLRTMVMPNGRIRKAVDVFPDVYSDLRMLRFLRKDKIQDPVMAALRYHEFLQWRSQNDIDSIRLLVESSPFEVPSRLSRVGGLLPCIFRAEPSQDGVVPVLLEVGAWDSVTIATLIRNNELALSTFLEYWIFIFESLHKHLYEESIRNKQIVQIDEVCDLKGMGLAQFSPGFISTVMKPWLQLTQSNYPETAKRIIFLNPPNILFVVWKLVTPMASPGTVAKVSLNSDFKGTGKDYYRNHYNIIEN